MAQEPRDLREFSRQTRRRLIVAGLILFLLAGTVLVALTYGTPAAGGAVAFFLLALVPVALVGLILALIQWIVRRNEEDSEDSETDAHRIEH
jgi:Mn2+/Fe2+ NRAMP family transporter